MADQSVDLVITDPPYNIGFNYQGEYSDNKSYQEYIDWSSQWLQQVNRVLKDNGTFWLVINDDWVAELKILANSQGLRLRSWVIWYYTFGVNCVNKFTRSHTHLLYFVKSDTNFTFNVDALRVPSAREAIYKDKRAKPGGRLPDDTWVLRPQQVPDSFNPDETVWHIPRLCGTFKERRTTTTQLPEKLVGRIIAGCSNPADVVLDPMAGSGTVLAVAKKLGRRYLGIEQSSRFCDDIETRLQGINLGDPLS